MVLVYYESWLVKLDFKLEEMFYIDEQVEELSEDEEEVVIFVWY